MYETHLTITGNVITPVVRRCLSDGTTFVTFRVASNERRFNRDTGGWGDGDSLYLSVTCWRQLAENVLRTFSVGDPIIVRGRLFTRNYEDKEGQQKSVTELEGLVIGPDLSRAVAKVTRLHRDGTPVGLVPSGADERREPDAGAVGTTSATAGAESDDPWRVARDAADGDVVDMGAVNGREVDDPFAERVDRSQPDGPLAKAAVGA